MTVKKQQRTIYAHYDASTGAHADVNEVMKLALNASQEGLKK